MKITGYMFGMNHVEFLDPATPEEAMSAVSDDINTCAARGIAIRKVTLYIGEEA